jgi:hypothetical protein
VSTMGPNTPEETRTFVEATVAAAVEKPRIQYAFAATLPENERVIGLGTMVVQMMMSDATLK